ncbi:MAG: Glycosyl transferase group 1 [Candidatus Amesbacteria bacterium GW2011_GWB1_47_19]|nr:MAG: Glycosyl transferase group 1 [Candidatus Amesbacteria bacterium GW2011_GWA1_44_24]KKU30959.1 MAG: hypothetical protein UX46_C0009G0035 [Candidatus Amesbacteria bacterium GW2011_GWC1_46_24]KKU66622.1 MAG: Glycosyl transferase group 1 [Candidatus Amesbacteria bacterium GW2011_GWB1_47_19]HBC73202.1 glycosyltransferase family 4 protein [Candidatus Amesbacteria bacterium]
MADISGKIALIYDRVNKWGGAEKVLLALHEIFPQAPLFTAVYDSARAPWASVFPQLIPSFMQRIPLAKSHHELYPWLTPLAFETLDLKGFEAVISVTSADAKSVITPPGTFHLCYCLTPTRYLWSHFKEYQKELNPANRWVTGPLFSYLKYWDQIASRRPDTYVSISNTVSNRIRKYYGLESQVIYPPVDIDVYSRPAPHPGISDFFLYVGRLVGYKRLDVVINVFNEIQLPLVVVGTGHLENQLRKTSGSHIHFTGLVSQETLSSFYHHCRAVIFFHEEDFGIVPLEAHAAGKPVIALNLGGASETVIHNQTGILVEDSSPDSLKNAILCFNPESFIAADIRRHAGKFSKQRFCEEFAKVFITEWKKYKNTLTS